MLMPFPAAMCLAGTQCSPEVSSKQPSTSNSCTFAVEAQQAHGRLAYTRSCNILYAVRTCGAKAHMHNNKQVDGHVTRSALVDLQAVHSY